MVVILLFALDHKNSTTTNIINSDGASTSATTNINIIESAWSFDILRAVSIPSEIIFVLLIVGLLIILWDLFERRSDAIHKDSGFKERIETVALHGNKKLATNHLHSEELQLSGEPTAIVKKKGNLLIPVIIKPSSNKVRDRHVIEILVHLRLLEAGHNKPPPHGIIIMGEKKRQIRIKYSKEKKRWLDTTLDEMRAILNGVPAVPAPARFKCQHCDVFNICEHSISSKPSQTKTTKNPRVSSP